MQYKILLTIGDETLEQSYRAVLKGRWGDSCAIISARSLTEAARISAEHPFDVVIVDGRLRGAFFLLAWMLVERNPAVRVVHLCEPSHLAQMAGMAYSASTLVFPLDYDPADVQQAIAAALQPDSIALGGFGLAYSV